ncbi:hypothetical protein [Mycobacterium talmoniae]|uniref:hypothetical protein n=1 Tax=Mycobacterium talmoniae TaxID=1858794 RepID=UPI0013F4C2B5|nr:MULTISPECIES: hypothetical protein [Mycobacterium]
MRRLAAQAAVAASKKTGRPVDPRVKKIAELELTESDYPVDPSAPPRSRWVRKLAAQAAVAASKKTGRPVDPRVKKIAESG